MSSKSVEILGRQFTATTVRCPHPGCQWNTGVHTTIDDIAPELIEAMAGKLAFTVFRDLVDHMRYFHSKHVDACPDSQQGDCVCAEHQLDHPVADPGGREIVARYHERKQAKRAAAIQAELDGKAFADKVANSIRSVIEPEVRYDPDGIRDDIGYAWNRDDMASRITERLGDQGLLRERVWITMTSDGNSWYVA